MSTVLELGRNHKAGKVYNRSLILRLILKRGPVSRLTLSRLTRLSSAALTILTGELIEEGLLIEVGGEEENTGFAANGNKAGRKSMPLDLNPWTGRTLGVHITPRIVRIGMVNLKGEILDEERLGPADSNPSMTLNYIAEAAEALMRRNNLNRGDLLGMGVGAVGLVDSARGINVRALSLGWENVPLKDKLERALGLPVYVDNNVRGMAMAEFLFGSGRIQNFRNIAVVYIGAGIGCGLIVEGKLYRGSSDAAGEIGHTIVDAQGKLCYCGSRGCLETIVGETAMLQATQEAASCNPDGLLSKYINGAPTPPTIEQVIEASLDGDAAATGLIENAGKVLGIVIVNLVKVINPDLVILSGRVTRGTRLFVDKVEEAVKHSGAPPGPEVSVMTSSMGDNIGMVGAAALALHQFFYSPGQEMVARR